ncbi:MAG: SDR family NAD(P)-dependent oxidoreductase [Proteobacteria bacterium]|nr:SDR family NAD(P)-dependent oxidoreductase [Pseudomonadota bacterium]
MADTKNILITGAAGGFGSELALQLGRLAAEDGLDLILLDNNEAGLDQLADRIQDDCGYEPLIYPLDLETSSIDQYNQMVAAFEKQLGKLDMLMHTAARFTSLAPMVHADPVEWLRVLQTNLNGPWLLTRACVPLLKQAGSARLIFMLEDIDTMREANWGSYGVSKVALSALVEQLKGELAQDGIRVNGINPGPMRTTLRAKAWMPSAEDPAQPVEDVAKRIIGWMFSENSQDQLDPGVIS